MLGGAFWPPFMPPTVRPILSVPSIFIVNSSNDARVLLKFIVVVLETCAW